MKTKGELRQHFRLLRQQLSAQERERRSTAVCERFFEAVPLEKVQVLHCYLPIERQLELDPAPILQRLRQEYPEILLVISRTLWEQRQMEHVFWDKNVRLEKNKWDIPEPVGGEICPADRIDAVLVPLLAFDRSGHRLGYGAGFYDRFLASCAPHALSIGLSYFSPLEDAIPGILPTDIPLTHCITPERAFQFQQT